MANFELNPLISETSLLKNPQDGFKSIDDDHTSIFGNFDTSFLKGINVMHSTENINTPFSYDNVINNVFEEKTPDNDFDYDSYEEDSTSTLGFEC